MSEFSIDTPSPDAGHEAIRVAVVKAIEDLSYNTGDIGATLSMIDLAFVYIDELLADISALNIRCDALNIRADNADAGVDALQDQVADLAARLDVLEPAVFTEP